MAQGRAGGEVLYLRRLLLSPTISAPTSAEIAMPDYLAVTYTTLEADTPAEAARFSSCLGPQDQLVIDRETGAITQIHPSTREAMQAPQSIPPLTAMSRAFVAVLGVVLEHGYSRLASNPTGEDFDSHDDWLSELNGALSEAAYALCLPFDDAHARVYLTWARSAGYGFEYAESEEAA